jgi:hypothetical protein
MMDKLKGRRVYLPRGREQTEDACILADAIAGSAADLFARDDAIIWIVAGRCMPVTPDILREIIAKHVVTKQLVSQGTISEVAYVPVEPDEKMLHTLLMTRRREDGSLIARLPKAAGSQRELPPSRRQEVRYRLRTGEPAAVIARELGVDADVIKDLAR